MPNLATAVLALVMTALPATAPAQPQLPTSGPTAEVFSEIAQFGVMQETCGILGYTIDPQGFKAAQKASATVAIEEGISSDTALAMVDAAITAREAEAAAVAEDYGTRLSNAYRTGDNLNGAFLLNDWYEHEYGICWSFTQSPRLTAAITAPADPQNATGYAAFTDRVIALLEQAGALPPRK